MILRQPLIEKEFDKSLLFEHHTYEDAITGITENGNICYGFDKMVDYLMDNLGVEQQEEVDFIEFNTVGSLTFKDGDKILPLIIYDL